MSPFGSFHEFSIPTQQIIIRPIGGTMNTEIATLPARSPTSAAERMRRHRQRRRKGVRIVRIQLRVTRQAPKRSKVVSNGFWDRCRPLFADIEAGRGVAKPKLASESPSFLTADA